MALWEVTLATAYFLGLRRTYSYARRIQRRLVGHDRLPRDAAVPTQHVTFCRRTRMVFGVAVKVHQTIQQRDIGVGRNLGHWILRCLDHVKSSAQICVQHSMLPTSSRHIPVHAARSVYPIMTRRPIFRIAEHLKRGRSFFTPWNLGMRAFPMMRPLKPAGLSGQYINLSCGTPNFPAFENSTIRHEGVFRKDIAQWMQQNP